MKAFDTLKAAVVSFIILDLTIMLLFTICAKTNEIVYADALNSAESYVGQPAETVMSNYGSPDAWQFSDPNSTTDVSDAYWYFGKTIFHISYEDPEYTFGTVVDVEVAR